MKSSSPAPIIDFSFFLKKCEIQSSFQLRDFGEFAQVIASRLLGFCDCRRYTRLLNICIRVKNTRQKRNSERSLRGDIGSLSDKRKISLSVVDVDHALFIQ